MNGSLTNWKISPSPSEKNLPLPFCKSTQFWYPKNRFRHTQLNVCEKEEFPCFLYLIQIFTETSLITRVIVGSDSWAYYGACTNFLDLAFSSNYCWHKSQEVTSPSSLNERHFHFLATFMALTHCTLTILLLNGL